MTMSNSNLVTCTKISPNRTSPRNHKIDTITIHCTAGQCTAQQLLNMSHITTYSTSNGASCNYVVGKDGSIGLCVPEADRSWCSSSNSNDQRAVTIECASDATEPYAFKDAVYQTLIKLCVDICKRNGKSKLLWLGDKDKTLAYSPKSDEMVLTVHRWFANKSCPRDWLYGRLSDLAAKVTAELGGSSGGTTFSSDQMYRVRKTWANAGTQKGAFTVLANAKEVRRHQSGVQCV